MLKQYQFGGPPNRSALLRADNPAGRIGREALFGWPGFGNSPYYYGFMQFQWATAPWPHWRLPERVVGLVDLRTLAQQAAVGPTPQGFAFVTSKQPIDVEIARSLHFGQENATSAMQDAWEAELGYRPQGEKVVDLLFDMLTNGSDPEGVTACKPLMPTVANQLELFMGGHSLVKRERFRFGVHPHTGRVRDLLRRQFEAQWEATNGHDHCRRCLDFTCEKYRVADWREFVPQRLRAHVPGRLKHQTTITESFPGTSATLGGDLTWTELADRFANASGEATHAAVLAVDFARAESALSSDDHYAQFVQTGSGSGERAIGPSCRFDPSAATNYSCYHYGGTNVFQLDKYVGGTQTSLATAANTLSLPDTHKVQADGSTIKGFFNGSEIHSVTDSAITGNVRCGLLGYGETTGDSFEAADLGGGTTNRRRRVLICGAAA